MNIQTITKKGPLVALTAIALLVGAAGGTVLHVSQSDAQTTDAMEVATDKKTQDQQANQIDQTKGGHVGTNGKKEELLTGDTAEKVKAAALKAVAGGTILRVETDAEGAAYEAHMKKADGSMVTVKFDSSLNVTDTESGDHGQMKAK